MKLPNGESAIVDDAKIRDYLLSPHHPIGRFKARVFYAAGYRLEDWQRLRDDLVALAATLDAQRVYSGPFGERWVGRATLPAPSVPLPIATVWLISSEGASPRLITAYPAPPL